MNMSIRKLRYLAQLFIMISGITISITTATASAREQGDGANENTKSLPRQDSGLSDILTNMESSAETVRRALNKSWSFARQKKNAELTDLTVAAMDNFAQIYRDYRELLLTTEERTQSMISLQNTLVSEQSYIDRITELEEDLAHSRNETQKMCLERDQVRTELGKVQLTNNDLRAQISISASA